MYEVFYKYDSRMMNIANFKFLEDAVAWSLKRSTYKNSHRVVIMKATLIICICENGEKFDG